MATIADEINGLRDHSLQSLDDIHNFYTHTKQILRKHQIMMTMFPDFHQSVKNQETQQVLDDNNAFSSTQKYVDELRSATFQSMVMQFEGFYSDVFQLWYSYHPGNLAGQKVEFEDILEAPNKEDIIRKHIQTHVIGMAYTWIITWRSNLESHFKFTVSDERAAQIAEAKATRDIHAHNRGYVNQEYLRKTKNSARNAVGDYLDIPEDYYDKTWKMIKSLIGDIAEAVKKQKTR